MKVIHAFGISAWSARIGALALACGLAATLVSCERPIEKEFKKAEAEAAAQNWRTAVSLFEDIVRTEPSSPAALKSAREAARIASLEIKDVARAIPMYRHLVLYSPDPAETLGAQKQIVDIVFAQIQDYPRAIEEISRLLQVETDPDERVAYRVKLARSYYHMNNFLQAAAELKELLRGARDSKDEFEIKELQANIWLADKKYEEAAVILRELLEKHRDQAIRENVPMTLAVALEEQKDFKGAIAILESVKAAHPVPEYVELRLKRLRERSMNQPGARGFRK